MTATCRNDDHLRQQDAITRRVACECNIVQIISRWIWHFPALAAGGPTPRTGWRPLIGTYLFLPQLYNTMTPGLRDEQNFISIRGNQHRNFVLKPMLGISIYMMLKAMWKSKESVVCSGS